MRKIGAAMTGCAKMVCSCQRSPLLSRFTPPVAASLPAQPASGFTLPTRSNIFRTRHSHSPRIPLKTIQENRSPFQDGFTPIFGDDSEGFPTCQWQVRKNLVSSQVGTQSYSSLSSTSIPAERKELSSEAQQSRLILVDGKALVYRAYYRISAKIFHGALKKMTSEDLPENSSWDSIMTTVVALEEILNLLELQPSHAAVVFDFPGLTFRHNVFPEYKIHRLVTPDTVRHAVRDTKHALLGMGVKVIEVPGVEADDVIGTLSVQAVEAGMKVRVASQDKDFFQILCPQLRLLRFAQKGPGFFSFGLGDFNRRYPGLQASQFVDMLALVGDPADNIPGVRGIGDVTARKLIIQFGTLENLLEQRNQITQTRARASLLEDDGQALRSKFLLLLKLNIPEYAIGCSLENLSCQGPEDGGKSYSALIQAFGAIVGREVGLELLERTLEYWRKL